MNPEIEEELAAFAKRLVGRLEAAHPELPGARPVEKFLGRVAPEPLVSRELEPTIGEGSLEVRSAMMDCQKPFQLWNVRRDESAPDPLFERLEPYKLGRAAKEGTSRDGKPGTVVGATKLLSAAAEDLALLRADAFGRLRRLRAVLRSDPAEEGLGLPD